MSKKDYRRRPEHQALYNSKEWQAIKRYTFERTGGLCERCREEGIAAGVLPDGYITPGVDCHHIIPWEKGRTMEEVKQLFFDRNNIRLLCIPCHIKTHQELKSHTKEKVKENKQRARQRFLDMNDPHYKTEEETMQKNKRLGIFGTLNYDKLKDMTMDERKLAVTNHAKDVLTRKTMDGKGPQIPDDDIDPYDVTAEYTIIDCRYNKQGKILSTFKAQRTDEDLTIELTSFEQVTT